MSAKPAFFSGCMALARVGAGLLEKMPAFFLYPSTGYGRMAMRLTAGVDTLTGMADDDTFQANVANNAGTLTQTLQAGDLIDGGEGNDTLRAVLNADAGATTISNVENIELRSIDSTAELDLANANSVENVTVANSVDDIALSNAGSVSNFNVNSQSTEVNVTGSTATALNLGFSDFGTFGPAATVGVFDINDVATSADVSLEDSNASITTAASLTDLSVEDTGENALLTASLAAVETIDVSGTGSVDFGAANSYAALETLTSSAEGGVTVKATNTLTSAELGAGDDNLIVTGALTSDTVYNLGAGDDRLELGAAPAAGATLNGGEGEDTIALAKADFNTVAAYTDAQRGLISNFETLEVTDALADADSAYDVSVIDGVTSFVAGAGVTTAESATVNGVTSGSTVGLAGDTTNDGELVVNVDDAATGTADALNVVLDKDISNGDSATPAASTVGAAGVETINVDSSFNATDALAATDVLTNTLTLNNDDLVTLNVAGDAALTFVADAAMEDLETIDASANEAGADITVDAALTQSVTITGTAEDDTVVLSANDVVDAGAGDDAITVADQAQVTGGEGDNTFTMTASANQVSYASIQDFDAGKDTLTATGDTSFNSDAITLQSNAVFSDFVEAASAGTAGDELSWFQFNDNTYVVNDASTDANFVNGADMIVELAGGVDLSDATLSGSGDLTIA
jgi:hypothetical protein